MVAIKFPKPDEGYAVLVELDKCIGCRACQVACKDWNGRKAEKTAFTGALTSPQNLTANNWKVVFFYEGVTRKSLLTPAGEVAFSQVDVVPLPYNCLHCVAAPCARACPVGAIKVTGEGAVVISAPECIGCGYCLMACPYDVPRKGEDGKYYKCTFCVDKIQNGQAPACVEVCPTGVFTFGNAGEIAKLAQQRRDAGWKVYGLEADSYVGGRVRWIFASSPRKSFAIDKHFADKKPDAAQQLREPIKSLTLVGAGLLALGLTAAGLVAWRKSRIEEKK